MMDSATIDDVALPTMEEFVASQEDKLHAMRVELEGMVGYLRHIGAALACGWCRRIGWPR